MESTEEADQKKEDLGDDPLFSNEAEKAEDEEAMNDEEFSAEGTSTPEDNTETDRIAAEEKMRKEAEALLDNSTDEDWP
jgi:hypothetical protein